MIGRKEGPIRILVVEDSPTAAQLLVALYQAAGDMVVIGTAASGEEAVSMTRRLKPDIISMDVRMPKMDGLAATRIIMREAPTPIVIVTASVMRSDIDLTFEALRAGALAVVKKPGLSDPDTSEKLIQTMRVMSGVPVIHHWGRVDRQAARKQSGTLPVEALSSENRRIQVIGIASSTGGPGTLATILGMLPADFPIPVLVVQHVTIGFAGGLAEWLDSQVALKVSVAGHGERPAAGSVLIAPDDYHLQINRSGVVELYKGEPYKGLRPSANYLFHSLAKAYRSHALGIILTGMGDDGVEGLEALHLAGGYTLAQDEQSCVVYGMPQQAVLRGAVDASLPPPQIGAALAQLVPNDKAVNVG